MKHSRHRRRTPDPGRRNRSDPTAVPTPPLLKLSALAVPVPPAVDPGRRAMVFIGLGWVLSFLTILAAQDFHPIINAVSPDAPPLVPWPLLASLMAAGLLLLVTGYRRIPDHTPSDVSPISAGIWLAFLFAVAGTLRLHQIGQPPGPYWEDWANNVVISRYVMDDGRWFLVFPFGGKEPFYPYVLSLMRMIMPDVRGFEVQRLASCLVDLLAMAALFAAGRELGSRRIGLMAAAMAAVSKPTVQLCVAGMRAGSVTLVVSLQILTLLWILKKPTLSRFLLWGGAMVLGVHTHPSLRPFMMIVPFLLLAWILRDPLERRWGGMGWLAVAGVLFSLIAVYDDMLIAIHPGLAVPVGLWRGFTGQASLLILALLMLIAASGLFWLRSLRTGEESKLAGFSLAVNMACLLVYPISRDYHFVEKLPPSSIFRVAQHAHEGWDFLLFEVGKTLRALFYLAADGEDLRISHEPFFDLFSQGAIVLGLVWLLARPSWRKVFLVSLAAVGTAMHVLFSDPASNKLIASAPAFFLLAAWAASRLWTASPAGSIKKLALAALMTGFWAWGAWIQHQKINVHWAAIESVDSAVSRQVVKGPHNLRIYLAYSPGFFTLNSQFVLNQGRRFYYLKNFNTIPLSRGEEPQDVVVIAPPDNQRLNGRLHLQYPSALWEKIPVRSSITGGTGPERFLWRIRIPGSSISDDAEDLLHRVKQDGPWLCRYYLGRFGWGLGGILREEKLAKLSGNLSIEQLDPGRFADYGFPTMVQVSGKWEVPQSGEYQISIQPHNPVWLRVDGKTILKTLAVGHEPEVQEIWLEKGTHQLDARVRLWNGPRMPQFLFRSTGQGEAEWKVL